jgi:1-deoxy-D-xylulose-5-phosphate reductoisomerase
MKSLSILGSTGSIGRNALAVVEQFSDRLRVKALAAKTSVSLLAEQIQRFDPDVAAVFDEKTARELKRIVSTDSRTEIMHGDEGYRAAATLDSVDMVLTAVVGAAGLLPTVAAIDAGKDIALANKETLVMAGEIVIQRAAQKKIRIIPVDSEHSAIFQCLSGNRPEDLDKILLTASGGPFLNTPAAAFDKIHPDDALSHPTWQMGKKITIDSATLMNKGLEVLEAQWLFGVDESMIEVIIHPQSIIHSMVAFRDGSVMAQLGIPDMKTAIAYAMSYPRRFPLQQSIPDLAAMGALTFQKPDFDRFPCLALAFQAAEGGGTLPAVMNAANEVAVQAFLDEKIPFTRIPGMIRQTMEGHTNVTSPVLSDILEADRWAREKAALIPAGVNT